MNLRSWVHDESPKDIDNLVQFVPNVIFLNKRQDSFHECAVEHSDLFAVLKQFDEHFRFLSWGGSHLLGDVVDSFQIGAVGAIGQHREYVGQEQLDVSAAADQFQHYHDCMFAVVLAAVGEAPEDFFQAHVGYLFELPR